MPLWLWLILWVTMQAGMNLMNPDWTEKQRLGSFLATGAAYMIFYIELGYAVGVG
jgi:hypothetical protein